MASAREKQQETAARMQRRQRGRLNEVCEINLVIVACADVNWNLYRRRRLLLREKHTKPSDNVRDAAHNQRKKQSCVVPVMQHGKERNELKKRSRVLRYDRHTLLLVRAY
jgi:hypothetical protein